MRNTITACLLMLACTATAMAAQDEKPRRAFTEKQLAQQQRMTDCNAEAKLQALRGEARKAFMQSCLSGGSVTVEVDGETATAAAKPRDAR